MTDNTCEDCFHWKDLNSGSLGQCRCEESPNYNCVLPKLNEICKEYTDKKEISNVK